MRARMTSSGYVTIDENVLATAPAQNVSTGPNLPLSAPPSGNHPVHDRTAFEQVGTA